MTMLVDKQLCAEERILHICTLMFGNIRPSAISVTYHCYSIQARHIAFCCVECAYSHLDLTEAVELDVHQCHMHRGTILNSKPVQGCSTHLRGWCTVGRVLMATDGDGTIRTGLILHFTTLYVIGLCSHPCIASHHQPDATG